MECQASMSWCPITAGRCLHAHPLPPACTKYRSWSMKHAPRTKPWVKAAAGSSQAAQPDASELDLLAMQLSGDNASANVPSVSPSVEPDVCISGSGNNMGLGSTTTPTTSSNGSSRSQRPVPKATDKVQLTKQEAREVSRRVREAAPQPGRRVLKVYRWEQRVMC